MSRPESRWRMATLTAQVTNDFVDEIDSIAMSWSALVTG